MTSTHPLDPLTAAGIEHAWNILTAERSPGSKSRVIFIMLHEPDKKVVLGHRPGDAVDRAAFVVLVDGVTGKTWEAVVSLTQGHVQSWEHVPGVQPAIVLDEFAECEAAVRADPRWQEAMRRRPTATRGRPTSIRRRRVRHRYPGERARERLRLPRRDPLSRRRRERQPRPRGDAAQRGVHHEEDNGILWKHVDWRRGHAEVRRSRRLVVSFIATVGNYEYGFYWYFYQDGTIELEVKMTGIISNSAEPPGVTPPWGEMVAPQVYGPIHQHFFNARLDMMVDGLENSVYEVNTVADPPGPDNPHHNAFRAEATLLASEARAARILDPLRGRFWKVVNPGAGGRGHETGGVHDPPSLGDASRPARALRRGRLPEPASRRRRAPGLRAGRRAAREHRRRALVHVRLTSRRPPRGLAGDVRDADRLQAQARGLLRPQPRARRARAGASLLRVFTG